MSNGLLHAGSQPAPPPDSYAGMEAAVIKVNFGLSWKQILTLCVGAPTFIASIGFSGWLVMPAKQSDVTTLERQVTGISHQVNGLQEVSLRLTSAVDKLATTVERLANRPQPRVVIPKRKVRNAGKP